MCYPHLLHVRKRFFVCVFGSTIESNEPWKMSERCLTLHENESDRLKTRHQGNYGTHQEASIFVTFTALKRRKLCQKISLSQPSKFLFPGDKLKNLLTTSQIENLTLKYKMPWTTSPQRRAPFSLKVRNRLWELFNPGRNRSSLRSHKSRIT